MGITQQIPFFVNFSQDGACDNNFYLKVTQPGKVLLKEVVLRPPYDGAKD